MPKLLFSKIKIYEFKDLIKIRKHPKRTDILLNRLRQKKDIQGILTQKINNDTFSTKDNSHEIQPTLEKVLKNKKSFAAFRAFLQLEFSEENIEFWLACKEYRETTPAAERPSRAAQIYLDFLHPLAQREINIDHHVREKIKSSIVKPSLSCFDEAEHQVYWLMEKDSCPRFCRTEAFQNLRQRKSRALW